MEEFLQKIISEGHYDLTIDRLDISYPDNFEKKLAYERQFGNECDDPPTLVIGEQMLCGEKAIINNLPDILNSRDKIKVATHKEKASIRDKFLSFSALMVMAAGSVDGINPCAFATIVFFISFLVYSGHSRKNIFVVGIFFIVAVFLTYLLIGLGAFRIFREAVFFPVISRYFYYAAALITLLLFIANLYDHLYVLRFKKTKGIKLQLPGFAKTYIHGLIRRNKLSNNNVLGLIIGSFILGTIISMVESICTGQVYLPTIALMLKDPVLKLRAFSYLIIYNLFFIMPLILVFILAITGVSSANMAKFSSKHIASSKMLLAVIFLALFLILINAR